MGQYTALDLPAFFDKWGVRYRLEDGWESRGRASGGFDNVFGVQIHHGADGPKTSLDTAVRYNAVTGPTPPIGNATISRDKDGPVVALYAALASNTAGVGGPRLTSRGVIPKDGANRITFAFEAENNGTDEQWSDTMVDLYVRATVAVLDWANATTPGAPLGAGDVFSHFEWTPGRKIDPSGPSRFNNWQANTKWNMDLFRGEVFALLLAGPGGVAPEPTPTPPEVVSYTVQAGDGWWRVSKNLGYPMADIQAYNRMDASTVLHPGMVLYAPGTSLPPEPEPAPVLCVQPQVSHPGDSGDVVVELQTLLKADTFYPYNVDGQYGPRTEQGVQKLQRSIRAQGFDPGPVDGDYGDQTRSALCALMDTPI